MKTLLGLVLLASLAHLVYARRLPAYSALRAAYPGRASDGGLYTDEAVMASVGAKNLTLNNTCPLRISVMLNLITFNGITVIPKGVNESQYYEMVLRSKDYKVNVSMYFMLDNDALMKHLNRMYGLPLVSTKVDDFKGRMGIILMSIAGGEEKCTALLWDGYGFFQARAFLRHTNLSIIYFWQTPDEPCNIVDSKKSDSLLCFPSDSTVQLDTGERVAMKNLRIGQSVKTVNDIGNMVYTRVVTFLQNHPQHRGRYYVILTESGVEISMTESHLIFKKEIEVSTAGLHKKRAVFASRIKPGDFIYIQAPGAKNVRADRVIAVALGEASGAFAPVTSEGAMLVDGALVSCFADIADHDLANSLMAPLRAVYNLAPNYLGAGGTFLHKYFKMVLRPLGMKFLGEEKFYQGPFEERGTQLKEPEYVPFSKELFA